MPDYHINKLDKVLEQMSLNGLDVVGVFDPINSYCITGYRGARGPVTVVIFRDAPDKPTLLIPRLAEKEVKESCSIDDIRIYPPRKGSRLDAFVKMVRDKGAAAAAIGIEEKYHSFSSYTHLKRALPEAAIKDCSALFAKVRAFKTLSELEFIRVASEIAKIGSAASQRALRAGMSEIDLAHIGSEAIQKEIGRRNNEFLIRDISSTTVAGVERTAPPYKQSSSNRITNGDSIIHVRVVTCNGYWAEYERTFLLGSPSNELKQVFDAATEVQKAAVDAIRPGVTAADVDRIATQKMAEMGFESGRYHFAGHAIGLGQQEFPFLEEGEQTPLEAGMVFSVEPGVYVLGIGGVRYSNMVAVTDAGHEIL